IIDLLGQVEFKDGQLSTSSEDKSDSIIHLVSEENEKTFVKRGTSQVDLPMVKYLNNRNSVPDFINNRRVISQDFVYEVLIDLSESPANFALLLTVL
ncbi:unnamed protein product, partial [Didymodactylos carnosus]